VGLDEPLVVQADEALLERALENLVRNALRPRPPAEGMSSFAPSAPLAWC
jgi:signal transduction histidine kinase